MSTAFKKVVDSALTTRLLVDDTNVYILTDCERCNPISAPRVGGNVPLVIVEAQLVDLCCYCYYLFCRFEVNIDIMEDRVQVRSVACRDTAVNNLTLIWPIRTWINDTCLDETRAIVKI